MKTKIILTTMVLGALLAGCGKSKEEQQFDALQKMQRDAFEKAQKANKPEAVKAREEERKAARDAKMKKLWSMQVDPKTGQMVEVDPKKQ